MACSRQMAATVTPASHLIEGFERVLREPALVIEGTLEGRPEEKRGGKVGVYRSVLIERIWSTGALLAGVNSGLRRGRITRRKPAQRPKATGCLNEMTIDALGGDR